MDAEQLPLFAEAPADDVRLRCAFGEPWEGPHPICEAEVEKACQRFDEAVARGEYDAQGYTPNERKAQARRAKKAAYDETQAAAKANSAPAVGDLVGVE